MIGQFLHDCGGHLLSHHPQEGHHDVMISLIIVQLRISPQNIQNDVDQLLLENLSLIHTHAWERSHHHKNKRITKKKQC